MYVCVLAERDVCDVSVCVILFVYVALFVAANVCI